MRRLLVWSAIAGFTACLIRPTLVAVTPEYGYVDGCTDIIVSGHDLGVNAKGKLVGEAGTVDLELTPAENDKSRPEWAQDVGFVYTATTPPAPDLVNGWFDVVLTVEGEELRINDGWYYRTCPAVFRVDAYEIPYVDSTAAIAEAGGSITFSGCGLTPDVELQFLEGDDGAGAVVATSGLVSDCSSAQVHFVIPELADGAYTMQLAHPDGTIYPLMDTCGDSGDTGACFDPLVIGGAR